MLKFAVRRLLLLIPILLGLSILDFLFVRALPGGPETALLGERVARPQRALAVALARDEAEILEPAQAARQEVGRDRIERAGEIAIKRIKAP